MGKLVIIIEVILVVLFFGMAGFLLYNAFGDVEQYREGVEEYNYLREGYTFDKTVYDNIAVDNSASVEEDIDLQPKQTDISDTYGVDFAALSDINSDIVGWIHIPDTLCDYPIVQTYDNSTYLKQTFSGEKNSAGAIFMEAACHSDFSSDNTIIYGHNMKNGTMFRPLRSYTEYTFFEEHPYVYLFTPTMNMRCRVVSVFSDNPNSFVYQVGFESAQAYTDFINKVKEKSIYDCGGIDETCKVITLSTCSGNHGEKRFIVICQADDVKTIK